MSSHRAVDSLSLLKEDATNRALRTFAVNLFTDVAVAVALVLVTAFNSANSWGELEWSLLWFTLGKTVVVTAGSFVMRRYLDASGIPTPLPPL